jgi:V8-like Glu-specific endopeptidase
VRLRADLKFLSAPVLAVALVALMLGAACAQAAPIAAPALSTATAGRAQSLRFWTAARMEHARPLFGRVPRGGGHPSHSSAGDAFASSAFETISDPTASLTRQNGAIFVVLAFGGVARCSGTSVNALNLSVVFTAGHCVHDGHEWLGRKWVFVPGYHNGERPFGVFAAKWLGSTPGWLSSGNENFDVGAAVVSRNERGQTLAAAAGGAGIAWGLSPNQAFDIYGYPVGLPFNGSTLQHCPQAQYEGHDLFSFLEPGPLNLAVECNVTGGASGGGWFTPDGLLNSVTTYGYGDDPATDFGPYFGKAVAKLFAQAAAVK